MGPDELAPIPVFRLLLCLLPVGLALLLLRRNGGEVGASIYAVGRMIVQLSAVGYALVFLFELDHAGAVLAVLAGMLGVASWITLRPLGEGRRGAYGRALAALAVGGGSVLALVTQGVLASEPWYEPRVVIPLAGMIFANSMNSLSVAAERFERERGQPLALARSASIRAGMIPVTNSLLAVGLVSLPGMMTGQILSGVSPLVATGYQGMVMCMLFGASGISIAVYLELASRSGSPASEAGIGRI